MIPLDSSHESGVVHRPAPSGTLLLGAAHAHHRQRQEAANTKLRQQQADQGLAATQLQITQRSHPSIPSKTEHAQHQHRHANVAQLHPHDSESIEAFSSRAARFAWSDAKLHADVPAVGAYETFAPELIDRKAKSSYSTQGYGGLVSQSQRFGSKPQHMRTIQQQSAAMMNNNSDQQQQRQRHATQSQASRRRPANSSSFQSVGHQPLYSDDVQRLLRSKEQQKDASEFGDSLVAPSHVNRLPGPGEYVATRIVRNTSRPRAQTENSNSMRSLESLAADSIASRHAALLAQRRQLLRSAEQRNNVSAASYDAHPVTRHVQSAHAAFQQSAQLSAEEHKLQHQPHFAAKRLIEQRADNQQDEAQSTLRPAIDFGYRPAGRGLPRHFHSQESVQPLKTGFGAAFTKERTPHIRQEEQHTIQPVSSLASDRVAPLPLKGGAGIKINTRRHHATITNQVPRTFFSMASSRPDPGVVSSDMASRELSLVDPVQIRTKKSYLLNVAKNWV